jgi:hypothetical protein
MRIRACALALIVGLCTSACGGGASSTATAPEASSEDSGGGDAQQASDATVDTRPDAIEPSEASQLAADTGSLACGTTTCGPGQLCAHPCCGGVAPSCTPAPASGCDPGFEFVSLCPGTGQSGCQPSPCTPDSPFCVDGPSQCFSACGCTSPECGTCPPTSGRDVWCVCG